MNAPSKIVSFKEIGAVGLIQLDNPPVNALSREMRVGVIEAIAFAANRPHIKTLLIISGGNLFSAGADLKEFDTGFLEPSLQEVQAAIELAAVPVVAAIHGLALGGGLEVAMACHYRVARTDAKLGLPEINLGIVPGAGGTQRLPRLVGARAALEMILSGAPISAQEGKVKGLVDEVVDGDLRPGAIAFCERLVQDGIRPRPTRHLPATGGLSESDITEVLRAHAKSLRGRTTQTLVVEAIQASRLPFAEGIAVESAISQKSLASRESEALRHVFFAERESGKVAGLPAHLAPPEIKHVAIIGAGTMGSAISIAFADAGRRVTLIDNSNAALARSQGNIRSSYASTVKRGRITQEVADQRIAQIANSLEPTAAADADMVIEAVFEDMDLKKEILSSLDAVISAEKLIATNTSTLSVTELGRATRHPDRVLGLHFFAPANVTKLLEIVRSRDSAAEALATALSIAKLLKKVPVVSGDAFGFIGNRMMLDGYFREAERLLLEGASPMQIDTALEKFGFAMGPQRVSDLGGNDVGTKARIQLYKHESRPDPYFVIADRLTELGRLGQKTGRGFYRYENGSRDATPDPDVTLLIETLASQRGIARREIGDDEIVERCLLALINVGAMVLDEGIAARTSDIDVVWTSGYGFPRHLGGPMFYADTLGLRHVAERIRRYHETLGHYWRPSKLIEHLAAENSSFRQWDRALQSR
ncbi:MAG TPA: 3-hydroxyacyl-CoA dehydrogenase NAD-binding domain-containing protein [Terriglobales bacterium]|nr:3-hydroxyacyl-CoA dehydrogenase NAD-binding domain-containing protein [Terriglobales bacterium]